MYSVQGALNKGGGSQVKKSLALEGWKKALLTLYHLTLYIASLPTSYLQISSIVSPL